MIDLNPRAENNGGSDNVATKLTDRRPENYFQITVMPDKKTLEDFLIGGRSTDLLTLPRGVIFDWTTGVFTRTMPEEKFDRLVETYKERVRNAGRRLGHYTWEISTGSGS